LILLGLILTLGIYAQRVNEIDMSVMRARHAVDSLVINDVLLQARTDSLTTVVDPSDSTATFTVITFDNGAIMDNSETDTLFIKETVFKIEGELFVTEHVTEGEHESGMTYMSTLGIQTINTGGTFERLNEGNMAYTGSHLHEFSHDDGRLTYTRHTDISMTVNATVSVESGETTQEVQLRIAKNGTTIEGSNMGVSFTAVNKNAAVPLFWMLDMSQNDYVEVWGTSDTNGDDIIINHFVMGITTH